MNRAADPALSARFRALALAAGAAALTAWACSGLEPRQGLVLSILSMTVVLWVSEVFPLYTASLLASFLLIVAARFPAEQIFQPYFDPVIVLFFGGFILACGLQKHGLDVTVARALLHRIGGRPRIFVLGMMGITAFLSMWMSNTAAAAIMTPVAVAVLRQNGLLVGESPLAKACLLSVAYAATLGGMATLVGSPPNAIASRYLAESDFPVGFVGWMAQALPFVLGALLYVWAVLCWLNPPEVNAIRFSGQSDPLDRRQLLVLGVFGITVLGWFTTSVTGLAAETVALIPVLLLFGGGLLDESDLGKINWGTLLLFGGGLSLGEALAQVKVDLLLAHVLTSRLSGLPTLAALLLLVFFGIAVTMVASNTASAAILIPLMLPLAVPLGVDPKAMAILVAMGLSLDFMMPVGTPPNAIAYSTGLVRVREMIGAGALMNLGTGILLAVMYYLLWL